MKTRRATKLSIGRPFRNDRGIALLLTLVILVLLTAIIVEFDYGAKVNLITAGNFRDEVRAIYLAKSGVAGARAALKDDAIHHGAYDDLTELWAQPIPAYPVGDGTVSIEVSDESGKIDLNRLGDKQSQVRTDTANMFKRFLKVMEVDPGLIDPIIQATQNWVNPEPTNDCFEEYYYEQQNPPYHCKKGPMDTLSELLLVRGITPEIYNKIRPYLTTVSEPNQPPININTAESPVLQSLWDDITPDTAACLQTGRPYTAVNQQIWTACPTDCAKNPSCSRQLGVHSFYFSVKSRGDMYDTEKIVTALIHRQGAITSLVSWQIE
ncbi:MAG TPA: type II secretion system minor pseudopilin GspK [Nitrospiria bacterium]|nr:type II secretion system minor pseudopilin GspK [Nitrospiria bacterium]